MKKYIKMIPLMLFPYGYLIWLISYSSDSIQNRLGAELASHIWSWIAIIYLIYTIFITLYNSVITARGKYTVYEAAKINLVVKAVQIPAYIFHFLLGITGTLLSVWGIGFILFAIIIDLMTIILTGINSIGCSIRIKKEHIVPDSVAVLMGIGCFIYCLDIIVAISYVIMTKQRIKQQLEA